MPPWALAPLASAFAIPCHVVDEKSEGSTPAISPFMLTSTDGDPSSDTIRKP